MCMVPHDSAKSRSVTEALSGPNIKEWMDAMKDEMESMQTTKSGTSWIYLLDARSLGTNGFTRSSKRPMGLLRGIRHV